VFRYLTEIEERLEQAEALLQRTYPGVDLGQLLQDPTIDLAYFNKAPQAHTDGSGEGRKFSNNFSIPATSQSYGVAPISSSSHHSDFPTSSRLANLNASHPSIPFHAETLFPPTTSPESLGANNNVAPGSSERTDSEIPLEVPPSLSDDFDWDEQFVNMATPVEHNTNSSGDRADIDDTEARVVDGMAALTMDEKDGGYLGVASGAALLRMLQPSALNKSDSGILDSQSRSSASEAFSKLLAARTSYPELPLYEQPSPNRHITDTMIEAYFSLYHVSYPIIHKPTFQAQYSGKVPRPGGGSWQVLAYTIAALGSFTAAMEPTSGDISIFMAAKSYLSINLLETGNITLVQALTLMSNYLQKRNKPNSGYNYLGIALRMAMGLGLHKEFQAWNISPLRLEIRRRVWWTLFSFDSGANITFSRPLSWPSGGIEATLPLNINDSVRLINTEV
jgi:transcriptional regulatory protein GAL4